MASFNPGKLNWLGDFEVFWVGFITTTSGMIIKLGSMAYKSKCKECSICCIKIIRDVELEERETEFQILHNNNSQEEKNNVS